MAPLLAPFDSTPLTCGNLIDGQSHIPDRGRQVCVRSPYDGSLLGTVPDSDLNDVNAAVEAASRAAPAWAETPLKERCALLLRFRELALAELPQLTRRVAWESGKTQAEAEAGVLKGIEVVEYALSLQNIEHGGSMEVSRGVYCETRRRPLGVVAGITPFNFPAMVPMWMFPIAIALGNAFILKPSDKVPLTAVRLGELMSQAGCPPGVFSIVHGGPVAVQGLLDHPDLAAIGFVGSSRVAYQVYRHGTQQGKRVLALGSAKNPMILLPDADPKLAIPGILSSFTGCAGQRCMAGSVLLAVGDCDAMIDRLVQAAHGIRLGSDMGAIIDAAALQRLQDAIGSAAEAGVELRLDGRNPEVDAPYRSGHWLGPTILDRVAPDSGCARQELFGPVLSIIRVQDLDAALSFEREGSYGNAVSVFTRSGTAAARVRERASAGMVGINVGVPVPREPFSFGGTKQSRFGHGDITGAGGVSFWSDLQKITSRWSDSEDHSWMS